MVGAGGRGIVSDVTHSVYSILFITCSMTIVGREKARVDREPEYMPYPGQEKTDNSSSNQKLKICSC